MALPPVAKVGDMEVQNSVAMVGRTKANSSAYSRDIDMPRPVFSVVVADTMGELMCLFGASDMVFVGGSLVPSGGHNMIEPAHWGLPVISGPSLYNFAEASRLLQQAKALRLAADASELSEIIQEWCEHPQARIAAGERALSVAEGNRGALEKLLAVIAEPLPVEHG